MYLTGGQFKGHKIQTPENTRPTLSKVRESIFNMLFSFNPDARTFLDMFAGSGIMGLEAISRGYTVKELEINKKSAQIIKENYKKINKIADISICDSLKFKSDSLWDVIYIDPPWENDYLQIIKAAKNLLNANGILIIEYDFQRKININDLSEKSGLKIVKEKKYGRTLIAFLTSL